MQNLFLDYRPAHLVKGKNNCYVAYSVVNPENRRLTVKRIKLNNIKKLSERWKYAEQLIKSINEQLARGFNPFLPGARSEKLISLSDAITQFLKRVKRQVEDGIIKNTSLEDYTQQLRTFCEWLKVDVFLYKLQRVQIVNFLDWLYIDKKLTSYTRNHYLQSIRTFLNFAVNQNYILENVAAGIENERNSPKKRKPIPPELLQRIFNYIGNSQELKYYYLACWLLFGCFIRPNEIRGLKINNISFAKQTIFIPAEISKNKKSQVVTIPQNVAEIILNLKLWEFPGNYFIIGNDLRPSEKKLNVHKLRDVWGEIRKKLKFPDCYQFYSLKDTGITKMINCLGDVRQVRDQARHSSIAITDVYTDRSNDGGNENIKKLDFKI